MPIFSQPKLIFIFYYCRVIPVFHYPIPQNNGIYIENVFAILTRSVWQNEVHLEKTEFKTRTLMSAD